MTLPVSASSAAASTADTARASVYPLVDRSPTRLSEIKIVMLVKTLVLRRWNVTALPLDSAVVANPASVES